MKNRQFEHKAVFYGMIGILLVLIYLVACESGKKRAEGQKAAIHKIK